MRDLGRAEGKGQRAELLLVGTNHRVATVDVRGRLAASCADAGAWLSRAAGHASIGEVFVLATCHRVEIYVVTADPDAAADSLRQIVIETSGSDVLAPGSTRYMLTGLSAVQHLCRVACGLDSMIVGEAEIAGQIRRAAMAARTAGTIGPRLERVLAGALRASGRARSETRIGRGALSAAAAAVSFVDRAFDTLTDRAALVVGAGQAGRQALDRLSKRRVGRLLVASRSVRHAQEAARRSGAGIVALDQLAAATTDVDVVIAATMAPSYVVDAEACRREWTGRGRRPRLFVDLSVPRVLDPALADLDGVTLRTVDDLGDIVRATTAKRLGEVPKVEAIVASEASRAYGQFRLRSGKRTRTG